MHPIWCGLSPGLCDCHTYDIIMFWNLVHYRIKLIDWLVHIWIINYFLCIRSLIALKFHTTRSRKIFAWQSIKTITSQLCDTYRVHMLSWKHFITYVYTRRMYDFHRRINKREAIVGWFSTTTPEGEFLNDTTYLFNDFYSKLCRRPIILVVDTSLSSGSHVN